eukprot:m.167545 g.167545  ORF g.167545 m.167545 type:complete len:478 (+) comp17195_c0_seq3:255-1688(+)
MAAKAAEPIDYTQRQRADVPPPTAKILSVEDVYKKDGLPDDELLLEHFKQEGRVTVELAMRIVEEATVLLRAEPNVLDVQAPVTIVGDIHGQFFDLVKLLHVGGHPSKTRYLFLGDYVDRGYFSLETVLYLFSLKLRYNSTFFMLRGNHECRHLTDYFTFKREIDFKCCEELYEKFMLSFDCLPLAAIMNKQFFCVHGGLSPEIITIDDIRNLNRFTEPEESGPLCDLLWSDPHENFDKNTGQISFLHNETRGCSYVYTHKAACNFLDKNSLLSVIRAHEAQDVGYRMYKPNPKTGFPSVITIFSAPNYLDVYGNKGAVMIYEDNNMNIKKFGCSPHPYWLPNFLDVFTWSLPFIGEKTTEMLLNVLSVCTPEELASSDSAIDELADKMKAAKSTIQRRQRSYSRQASINQAQLLLHGVASPTGDVVSENKDELQEKISTFEGAKSLDRQNEALPTRQDADRARKFRRKQTLEDIDI